MKSVKELDEIKRKYKDKVNIRTSDYETRIIVGMGNSGIVAGARDVLKVIVQKVEEDGLNGKVIVTQEARISRSGYNPVVCIVEHGITEVTYGNVTNEIAARIVDEHIKDGKIIEEYVIPDKKDEEV